MKTLPNYYFEKKVWRKGFEIVGGCDEVGRGCLAGPVACGCVVFTKHFSTRNIPSEIRIDDSKKLSAKQRDLSAKWIKRNCLTYGIGAGTVSEINKYGIVRATQKAFRRAVKTAQNKLGSQISFILFDAFYVPNMNGMKMPAKKLRKNNSENISGGQLAIINGDEKSVSIAASSIVAKVYRDNLMTKLSAEIRYKEYGWDKNKGYGTKVHIKTLKKLGPTKIHRRKFIEKIIE